PAPEPGPAAPPAAADLPVAAVADDLPFDRLAGGRLRSAVEAILFVVDRPTTSIELAQVLDVPRRGVDEALAWLRADLDEQDRGFELREVAGGWRLYTRDEFALYVERYLLGG